jgi:glycosyltransferase EpsF
MDRILQVVGGMNRAGAETMLMNAYRAIDRTKLQFDFLVYSEKKQDYEDEIYSLGGRVIRILGGNPLNYVRKIDRVISEYGPYTAVHAHMLHNNAFAMIAAKRYKGVLRISHSHNTKNRTESGVIINIYEILTKRIIQKESQIWLACGREAGEYLFGKKFNIRGKVVNNGVDLSVYNHRSERCEDIVNEFSLGNKLVIGNIARLTEVKNHKFMIEIANHMKKMKIPFKMLLVGQGELKEELQQMINNNGLNDEVVLTGVRSDIPDLLQVFDVFIMPSLFEGNPVTLVEAQASGLPCVISDVITDKIDMGLGLMYKCSLDDTVEKWIEEIIKARNNRCYDYEKIRECFQVKKYDSKTMADELEQIYQGKEGYNGE